MTGTFYCLSFVVGLEVANTNAEHVVLGTILGLQKMLVNLFITNFSVIGTEMDFWWL